MLRVAQGKTGQPSSVIFAAGTVQSTCKRGARAAYEGYQRKKGSKVPIAGDPLERVMNLSEEGLSYSNEKTQTVSH